MTPGGVRQLFTLYLGGGKIMFSHQRKLFLLGVSFIILVWTSHQSFSHFSWPLPSFLLSSSQSHESHRSTTGNTETILNYTLHQWARYRFYSNGSCRRTWHSSPTKLALRSSYPRVLVSITIVTITPTSALHMMYYTDLTWTLQTTDHFPTCLITRNINLHLFSQVLKVF